MSILSLLILIGFKALGSKERFVFYLGCYMPAFDAINAATEKQI